MLPCTGGVWALCPPVVWLSANPADGITSIAASDSAAARRQSTPSCGDSRYHCRPPAFPRRTGPQPLHMRDRPRASHDRHEPLISRDSRAAANPQSFLVDVNRVGSAFRPSLGTLLRQAGRAPGDSLRSAQQDNARGQRRGLHAEQLLDLSNEILKLIDLKGAVDQAALEVGIENNDPAGPITVDLVHNAR